MKREHHPRLVLTRTRRGVDRLAVRGQDVCDGTLDLVAVVATVHPAITPLLHLYAASIHTGELGLGAASQGEDNLIGEVWAALSRVVVNCPFSSAQESRLLTGRTGGPGPQRRVVDVGGYSQEGCVVELDVGVLEADVAQVAPLASVHWGEDVFQL